MREGLETKVYIWQAWVRREWEYLPDVSMYLWFNVVPGANENKQNKSMYGPCYGTAVLSLRSVTIHTEQKTEGQCGSSSARGHGRQDHGCILFIKDKSTS